ncbi:MAG: DUF493 family protein, partial [Neisseriaceae bacterium]|nr:DUF493 family protein [Neisseriaceae bacterium]
MEDKVQDKAEKTEENRVDSENKVEEESLIEFPSRFPIKVMGVRHERFPHQLLEVIQPHDAKLTLADITIRESSKGNYLGATVTVNAESKAQLDAIYLALTGHPLVKVV